MSVATMARDWQRGLATRTVRQFGLAVGFALAALGAGCLLYLVETCLLQLDRRFIENPGAVMMNACGLAFVVAGSRWAQPDGQIMFILVISLAAAEAAIGLAILLQLYRRFDTLSVDAASEMRG